jgi:CHASE2 domain-containing protein
MHDPCIEHEHAEEGWFLHFLTGLLLGLIAIVATAFLHDLPSASALDHLGDNLAQQVYAGGEPLRAGAPKLVLLDFDFSSHEPGSSEVARITRAVRILAPLRPRMLVIDQEIQAASKEVADDFVAAVQSAAPLPVVLAAVQVSVSSDGMQAVAAPGPVDVLREAPNVRFGSPTLLRDADGLIRSVPRTVCLTWPDRTVQTVPSLATSPAITPTPDCQPADERLDIIYSLLPGAREKANRVLPRITEEDLRDPTQIETLVQGAIVIIGETGAAAWRDVHPTPLGMMQGSLIQANALLAAKARIEPLEASWWQEGLAATVGAAVCGGCFLLYHRWRRRRPRRQGCRFKAWAWDVGAFVAASVLASVLAGLVALLAHHDFADTAKAWMEVLTVVVASVVFASYGSGMTWLEDKLRKRPVATATVRLVCYLPIVLLLLVFVASLWIYVGSQTLHWGWHTASLVPIFAAGLEALLKAGGRVMHVLESVAAWLMRVVALTCLILLISAVSPAAAAEPPGIAEPAQAPAPHTEARGPLTRSVQAFWGLIAESRSPQGPTTGAGVRIRGAGGTTRLEWLPIVPMDGPMLPAGSSGLALAWQGGAPPYLVEVTGQKTGDALGSFRPSEPYLWVPTFRMPAEPVVLSVRDAGRGRLSATLIPADVPPPLTVPADAATRAPASAAIALFVDGGPAWRLEALRQLSTLAPKDAEASEALAGVRSTARTEASP